MDFKQALRDYLLSNDISQERFAGMIGRNRATVYNLLTGKKAPSSRTKCQIKRATNNKLDYDAYNGGFNGDIQKERR